jgi:hypothetical protein
VNCIGQFTPDVLALRHLMLTAYGTNLGRELSRKLGTAGVDMLLSYYRYQEAAEYTSR